MLRNMHVNGNVSKNQPTNLKQSAKNSIYATPPSGTSQYNTGCIAACTVLFLFWPILFLSWMHVNPVQVQSNPWQQTTALSTMLHQKPLPSYLFHSKNKTKQTTTVFSYIKNRKKKKKKKVFSYIKNRTKPTKTTTKNLHQGQHLIFRTPFAWFLWCLWCATHSNMNHFFTH